MVVPTRSLCGWANLEVRRKGPAVVGRGEVGRNAHRHAIKLRTGPTVPVPTKKMPRARRGQYCPFGDGAPRKLVSRWNIIAGFQPRLRPVAPVPGIPTKGPRNFGPYGALLDERPRRFSTCLRLLPTFLTVLFTAAAERLDFFASYRTS
jgi:hypothetical protein